MGKISLPSVFGCSQWMFGLGNSYAGINGESAGQKIKCFEKEEMLDLVHQIKESIKVRLIIA